jgi:hypothetical protein
MGKGDGGEGRGVSAGGVRLDDFIFQFLFSEGTAGGGDLARVAADPLTQRGHRAEHLPYVKLVEDRRLSRGVQPKHDNLLREEERASGRSERGGER